MRYSEAESAAETGLKSICVDIRPALNSSDYGPVYMRGGTGRLPGRDVYRLAFI